MFSQLSTQQWIGYGAMLGLMALFYFRVLRTPRPELPQRRRPFVTLDPDAAADAKPVSKSQEMMRWEVEMHDTARELKAELHSKMSALMSLVRTAREEQERLTQLIDTARSLESKR
jgi:hypothetical protein